MPEAVRSPFFYILLLLLLLVTPAIACPYPPSGDLWDLVEKSDRIVIAEVVAVKPKALNRLMGHLHIAEEVTLDLVRHLSPDGAELLQGALENSPSRPTPEFVAELRVVETLRGFASATIHVEYDGWGPAVVPGELAIAFLDGNRFVAYSNSILYTPDAQSLLDLRSVLLAAGDLQDRGAQSARTDWAVAAATLPGSRQWVVSWIQPALLSVEHKRSLAEGFLRFPSYSGFRWMLELLDGYSDPAFDRRAAALVSTILSDPALSHLINTDELALLLSRLGNEKQVQALGAFYGKPDLQPLVEEAVAKLNLPADLGALFEVRTSEAWQQRFFDKLQDTYG